MAIAMGRCLTARSLRQGADPFKPTLRHPRECGWCPYPVEELQAAVIEFNNWAQFNDRASTTGRHATRSWSDLPRDAQEARIVAAQALVDKKPVAPEKPSPPVVQEDPSWAR